VIFTYVLTTYISYIYSLHRSPPSPVLRRISTSFILLFSYVNTKHSHQIHLHSPYLMLVPLPLVPIPRKDLFYSTVLHFLDVY
jgi:hypothetical protein